MSLDVGAGEIVALMGTSGMGKSTVLRAIAALQPFSGGTISVGDFTLRAGPVPPESRLGELRARVGMVFQSHALFGHLTVLENLTLAPVHSRGWAPDRATAAARAILESLGIAGLAASFPGEISGGQAQRVAIARSLVLDPQLLLMDEPTSALDPDRRVALGSVLRGLTDHGRALLIATHDTEFARACADRIVILADGVILSEATGLSS
jgi:ABC-type polar amino acid transport system ATPase subunit